jgi:hypothetical protein
MGDGHGSAAFLSANASHDPGVPIAAPPLVLGTERWLGIGAYAAAGLFVGVAAAAGSTLLRRHEASAASAAVTVTDPIIRLHARDIGAACWAGIERVGPARLTVSLEVGMDGKVHYAAASGGASAMRACVETHVRAWEFLPQAHVQTMALPIEVDRR